MSENINFFAEPAVRPYNQNWMPSLVWHHVGGGAYIKQEVDPGNYISYCLFSLGYTFQGPKAFLPQ